MAEIPIETCSLAEEVFVMGLGGLFNRGVTPGSLRTMHHFLTLKKSISPHPSEVTPGSLRN